MCTFFVYVCLSNFFNVQSNNNNKIRINNTKNKLLPTIFVQLILNIE